MSVLRFTLIICAIAGCWHPISWKSIFKSSLYKAHRIFLIFLLYTFSISQFMNIILNVNNSNEVTETMYMMLTVCAATYKIVSMWINRKNVTMIVIALAEKPFKPSGSYEVKLQLKYDKIVQNNTLRYLILIMTTVVCMIFTSVFMEFMKKTLTYKAWLPFDYTPPVLFFLVYVHQMMSMSTCAIVNVACDSLICGLLVHICCQLDILEYRLTKISQSPDVLRDCVYHHDRIFEFANVVNDKFAKIIAIQFAVSMLVMCSNLYQLAMSTISANYIPLILYTVCILMQIFIYCWFGNEVKLKSLQLANNIYNIQWMLLNNENKKGLLLIMKRAMTPIEITSAHIVTLNLDSFVALLKTSYSAFNLLQRTQE